MHFPGVTLMQQHSAILLPQCADRGAKVKTRMGGESGVLQQGRERRPADSECVQAGAQVRIPQVHSFGAVCPARNDTRDAAAERERGVCEVHATQYLQTGRFEKDARTSRHDARQSLEHAHFVPGPRQEHGGRETRNAAADDRYAQGMCPGRLHQVRVRRRERKYSRTSIVDPIGKNPADRVRASLGLVVRQGAQQRGAAPPTRREIPGD
jgi:hypothetical protein